LNKEIKGGNALSGENKAAILYGPRDIRIEDRDIPSLGQDEVLIRSLESSICATEVKYWYYGIPNVQPGTTVIQGHELGGIVEDTGKGIRNSDITGTRVAIDPSLWCGLCDMCISGMSNLCRNIQFMSLPPVDGGFQQFYKAPYKNIHPIPDNEQLEYISIVEPVAIGINAISDAERIIGTISDKTVAILGAGSLGLFLMQSIALKNPKSIYIIEPLEYRRKLAMDLGNQTVVDPINRSELDNIIGHGVDLVFEAAGESDSFQLASEIAKPGGIVIIIGIPINQEYIPIKAIAARRTGLTLKFVRRFNPKDFPKAIELLTSGKIIADGIITHTFGLEDISRAFEMVHKNSDNIVKAVIYPNPC